MTKTDLYNFALSVLDLNLVSIDEDTKERKLLDLNYPKVVQFVLKAHDWSFMVKQYEFTEDDLGTEEWKYTYGYPLPSDFGYAVNINGDNTQAFSVRFGKIWTNYENPILEYIPNEIEEDIEGHLIAPPDFLSLIAYQLALHIAPFLDPDSSTQGIAAQMYQLTFESIRDNETRSNDRPENFEADDYWGEDREFDLMEYRRMLFEAQR
jgi:hypothetical protein